MPESAAPILGATVALAPVAPHREDTHVLSPLGVDAVTLTGGWWGRWQELNRTTSIPHGFRWLEDEGSIHNLEDRSQYRGLRFTDSDFYKALEAAFWDTAHHGPDETLNALIERSVTAIQTGLGEDGYINSYVQAGRAGRYVDMADGHELYCMGHLLEAATTAWRTNADQRMLDIAVAVADQIDREFGQGRRTDYEGHPEVELALVGLYRITGEQRYLDLAQQFVTFRGRDGMNQGGFEPEYYQDAVPYRDQPHAVGHAVRALYLMSGALDVYLETGDESLLTASLAQWDDVTSGKLFLTGAVGSRFEGEAFGAPFELAPDLVYGETCASIALAQVAWRLLLITGESRFADVIEQVWYNVLSASTSLDRNAFFYVNPLQRRETRSEGSPDRLHRRCDAPGTRPGWYECACCPPNIMRTIASLGAYVASHDDAGILIHQYLPGQISHEGFTVSVTTHYPHSGRVQLTVTAAPTTDVSLSVRVPRWVRGAVSAQLNGTDMELSVTAQGYATLNRTWTVGDVVTVDFAIAPVWITAHPAVDAVRGQVALQRGPVVYCVEGVDHPELDLNLIAVNLGGPVNVVDYPTSLQARAAAEQVFAPAVQLDAVQLSPSSGELYQVVGAGETPSDTPVTLTAIPYALWANRGSSSMRVWLPAR